MLRVCDTLKLELTVGIISDVKYSYSAYILRRDLISFFVNDRYYYISILLIYFVLFNNLYKAIENVRTAISSPNS